ncbi:MAG: shikimate dehydrogenase [Rhodoluna sp.]|nr:shikimate dehydrogenase [Rhodoluna sp.]MBP6186588.1 shikimate dehydrogenase [Rhodoluna sp.]
MSRHLAVLGSPISHSKSPDIHTAAYRTLQLNWDYSRIEIELNRLMQFVEALDSDWLGLSLTMPLKEEALKIANEQSALAAATGVANTLIRTTSGWTAHNTDVFGIEQSLIRSLESAPGRVVILGSGATATSAMFAVSRVYPNARITLVARNKITSGAVRDRGRDSGIRIKIAPMARMMRLISQSDLVISTLPPRGLDQAAKKLTKWFAAKPRGVLLDVAYDPWPSSIARVWLQNKRQVISGVEMLIWQAIAQIRIFNHNDIDVELPNERAVELSMRHALGLI